VSVPPRAQRTTSFSSQGQPICHRRLHASHLEVPRHDVRAPKTVSLDRYLRHQDAYAIYSERGKRLGRQLVPRHRQLGLAARSMQVQAFRQIVRTPHSRPFRFIRQQANAALQRQVARRYGKSSRQFTSNKCGMEEEAKLLQSSLGFTRQLGRQATKLGSRRYRHCSLLAQETVVHPPLRHVDRDRRHVSGNKPFISTEAASTRGGRAFRLERRSLSTATPPWIMLRSRQLHEGVHLQPVLDQTRQDAVLATTRKHSACPRRYDLHIPTTSLKRMQSSGTVAMNSFLGNEELGKATTSLFHSATSKVTDQKYTSNLKSFSSSVTSPS
jgi:hypothetical protein